MTRPVLAFGTCFTSRMVVGFSISPLLVYVFRIELATLDASCLRVVWCEAVEAVEHKARGAGPTKLQHCESAEVEETLSRRPLTNTKASKYSAMIGRIKPKPV
ncbi:unnamed protein product [Cylicocyclus nassatus]|uniref:Uncharacterized protein n=1 Tax=Cylicocyclus nassatus TaxID=53992 RepID=A0AA36HDY7_CYLNA|nr:unnamed protein product [Cylicocyclus nassatus]